MGLRPMAAGVFGTVAQMRRAGRTDARIHLALRANEVLVPLPGRHLSVGHFQVGHFWVGHFWVGHFQPLFGRLSERDRRFRVRLFVDLVQQCGSG